ncbi:hypothetical protein B0H63DRAFT_504482 [Podospora didyma]|uniref:NmrA-like domain-containing protein n=1 Tax=Podospora didyma TaxID=330526 RepID=A0AAE0K041_9PEZI|nr:hypothetical protein B0H63DRAFT_504482 [Podospora didyma]
MSKILAVFGATGTQGGSVVNFYKIRAITRDINSEKAKKLQVDVVQADVTNQASLEAALTGVHTVFAMTNPHFGGDDSQNEFNISKAIADTAVSKGVAYIVFSTLPPAKDISGGKFTKITSFDDKARAQEYIRTLPIKSAFCSLGYFMENLHTQPFLAPHRDPDIAAEDTWVLARNISPATKFPLLSAAADTGKFVGAILAEPDKYEGTTLYAATSMYSLEEQAAIISKVTGKKVVYKQLPTDEFKAMFLVLPIPGLDDLFAEAFQYGDEFGYYGPDTEKLVAWSAGKARVGAGKLATFEEFLKANPLQLQ